MTELLVVNSKVREAVKKLDTNTSSDFAEALSGKVGKMIKEAVERARANSRKTVRGYDL